MDTGEKTTYRQMVLEKLGVYMKKNEFRALSLILHKIELLMDEGPQCKS